MNYDVFISHAEGDAESMFAILHALERARLQCWIAKRDMRSGGSFARDIPEALRRARLFLVIVSPHAYASAWVEIEVEEARGLHKPILPVGLDTAPLRAPFDFILKDRQVLSVSAPPTDEQLQRVVQAASSLLAGKRYDGGSLDDGRFRRFGRSKRRRAAVAATAIAVLGISLVAIKGRSRAKSQSGFVDQRVPDTTIVATGLGIVAEPPLSAAGNADSGSVVQRAALTRSPELGSDQSRDDNAGADSDRRPSDKRVEHPALSASYEAFLDSEPRGAEVSLNGIPLGTTPHTHRGRFEGEAVVTYALEGYQTHYDTLRAHDGIASPSIVRLAPLPSTLTVQVSSPNIAVFVDDAPALPGPNGDFTVAVSPGEHTVRAEHPVWGAWEKKTSLAAAAHEKLIFDYERTCAVKITSDPLNAKIYVDGAFTGRYTPVRDLNLRPGRRSIAVRKDGYSLDGGAKTITVDETTALLRFDLRKIP